MAKVLYNKNELFVGLFILVEREVGHK